MEKDALRWIVDILEGLLIPYQVSGGLAARAYGSSRLLHDIDIYIPSGELIHVARAVEDRITRPVTHDTGSHWDRTFFSLEYEDMPIEITAAENTRYFDAHDNKWKPACIDFDSSVNIRLFDILVPVMGFEQLSGSKWALSRDVDYADLAAIDPHRYE